MILAGAATADITPGAGVTMGGYGARQGRATGELDPLLVRALVVSDGRREVAVAVCDLLGVGSDLVRQARDLIASECSIAPDHVLIGATHTHSGPAGIRPREDAAYVAVTARKIAGAVDVARRRLEPVVLKSGTATVPSVSLNRRDPEGPVQQDVHVLVFDTTGTGPPVATVVNFACHATVLEHDNLEFSADWPGAMNRFVERNVGGVSLFVQGAAGDVNPVWSRHDGAEVARIGGIVGAAVVRLVHEMRPLDKGQWSINLSWSEDVEVQAVGRLTEELSLAATSRTVEVTRRQRDPADVISAELAQLHRRLETLGTDDVLTHRQLRARINELTVAELIARAGPARSAQSLEVQAIRLSEACAVLALPGEFFVETGRAIVRDAGLPMLLVAGYANGSVGYVPPAHAYPEAGYEVGISQFGPEAEALVVSAALETLRGLY
ncbi:MAG TPA: neutral/alkaline non-lysosomal ceramidase N-terminal domain-containing protein [Acidimicrobiales bacterium]|nr:neutral/alkaline non-lysosomal ceramidase N-terminal domain-containing protein [Acidimicrobiales bacterium]